MGFGIDGGGNARRLSRRQLVSAGVGAALTVSGARSVAGAQRNRRVVRRIDFTTADAGSGWGQGWRSVGVANLRRVAGEGLLEAGSDVFPNDPRPVAFAADARIRDGEIVAELSRAGSATGVVLRRSARDAYYAAVFNSARSALVILRRDGVALDELAGASAPLPAGSPVTLALTALGTDPTELKAVLTGADGRRATVSALDSAPRLQRAGDAGVLASAETLFPSDPGPVLPALGNLHLLPWAVQEGQAFMATPAGEAIVAEIRRRSTAGFRRITISSEERARPTAPSVIAATTGAPLDGGARLHVAADAPSAVAIELSYSPRFRDARTIEAPRTGRFNATTAAVRGLEPGRRVYWRARLRRRGRSTTGPVRSFRVQPRGGAHSRLAIAACAAQFGPIFSHLARHDPDVLVWQGDLNYPDTHGPLAQTTSGYAGIWRDFLANPLLIPLLERTAFAAQRDDHDYGVQDANASSIADYPWGLAPWRALINPRTYFRFGAGAAEVWVLDQRRFKSDPGRSDGPGKTLLGPRQRRWLLRTLAASEARFKLICSPCTIFIGGNARDGNWSAGFESERELILEHIRRRVRGRTLFLTGDRHLTGVYDDGERFEARAAPIGIPRPNDVTLVEPLAATSLRAAPHVAYAADECHFTLIDVRGSGGDASLEISLVREDGATPYRTRFEGR